MQPNRHHAMLTAELDRLRGTGPTLALVRRRKFQRGFYVLARLRAREDATEPTAPADRTSFTVPFDFDPMTGCELPMAPRHYFEEVAR